jgi:hypothetical protein
MIEIFEAPLSHIRSLLSKQLTQAERNGKIRRNGKSTKVEH